MEGGFHHDPLFDRKSHPGAGANTAYHNFTFVATKDINVGDEVFIGSAELGNHSVYSNLPTWNDYDRANKIIDDLKKFRESHPELSQMQWISEFLVYNQNLVPSHTHLVRCSPRRRFV